MAPSATRRLLRRLDPLPHPERQRLLAAVAHGTEATELRELVADLYRGDPYARLLSLRLAAIAGERDHVERCLAGPETALRGHALVTAVRLSLPTDTVLRVLPELPAALRRVLYQAVRMRGHHELAEQLLPAVRARFGDIEAAALLATCSTAVLAPTLDELAYAVPNWGALGNRHPGVVLDHLDAELDRTAAAHWPEMWHRLGPALAAAAPAEPDRVLGLLERTIGEVALPGALRATIGALARHDPARLLGILLDPRRIGSIPTSARLWRALLGAPDTELTALARVLTGDQLVRLLHVLAPSRRAAVYAGAVGERDLASTGVPLAALDELPAAARAAEARRLLTLHSVADDPRIRLAVTARTEWDSAAPVLADATGRATADERADGYRHYIAAGAATRESEHFGAVLASLTRLRNEQDPVCAAALSALAAAPPWLFRPVDVPVLTTLFADAAQARDISLQSQGAIRTLATGLIRQGAAARRPELVDCGLAALEKLGGQSPWLDLSGMDRLLPRGAEREVFTALRPRIVAEAQGGQFGVALSLAAGLGRRAWHMSELQEFVDQARRGADDQTVRRAIELWLAPSATRDQRVEAVLHSDRSTITLPAVQAAVGSRRTDLLDEVFAKSLHGRFLHRRVRFIPPFSGSFHRWLPRQCAHYLRLLAKLAGRTGVQVYERAQALHQLRGVPGSAETLRGFVGATDVRVAEAALAALAWTDEPVDVLPNLLAFVDTDRARVAVYAAVRCARFVPPDQLGTLLTPVLAARKVTSRTEAVRLCAEHRVPGAADLLATVFHTPGQHRDVRCAVVSAARLLLDEPQSWELLTAASGAEHAVAAAAAAVAPEFLAVRHRSRYAGLVRAVAAAADPDTARLGLLALPAWSRWDDTGSELLVDLVTDLDATPNWRLALTTLVAMADPAPVLTATHQLLKACDFSDADRDLPARQRVLALAREVGTHTMSARPTASAVADLLGEVATYRAAAVELAVAAAVPAAVPSEAPDLRSVLALVTSPKLAWHAADVVACALRTVVTRIPDDALLAVAESLRSDAAPLALALARTAGPVAGWPEPWRKLVAALRSHDDPDVRREALDTFTRPE